MFRKLKAMNQEQYAMYLLGCLVFSIGAGFFITSKLGTDPLDVLALGLRGRFSISVGLSQAGFAALCLLTYAAWTRRRPPLSPLFTFFFCGSLIDIWLHIQFVERFVRLEPFPTMLCGVALCAYGSSLIIMSGIGIRAMDLIALTMLQKWGWPFWLCKGLMEFLLLTAGWALGGPVGIGTVFFLGFVGWLIQPLVWVNASWFRLEDYGLKPVRQAAYASGPEAAPR